MPEHRADSQTHPPAIGGDAIAARVVVVGRTGLDARLRLDPGIELIRVRSAFDAIGELGNPIGEVPGRTVVIVGSGGEITDRNGGDGAFVSAARRVAPDAIVVRCVELGANSADPGAYDRVVLPSASSDELRELIHGRSSTPPPRPDRSPPAPRPLLEEIELEDDEATSPRDEHVGRDAAAAQGDDSVEASRDEPARPGVPDPVLEPSSDAAAHAELKPVESSRFGSGDGDDVLVAAALAGRDILEPALGLIRARVGRGDVEFIPHDDEAEGDEADSGERASGVEVAWSGRRFGSLRIAGIDAGMIATGSDDAAGRLVHHAQWLGTWLALAEQQRRLRLEAYTDPVSGAWNRRYFDRFLETALPHARKHRYKLTVLVFDLDNFKSFNDRFGHEAGDMILTETVRLLRSMTRPSDRICRIGGDEFAVIFYEPEGPRDKHSDHPEAFEVVAGRFQKAVEEQRFPKLGIEAPGELTISGGLATFPWDGQTADDLLRRADELAIASKRAGKNQITLGRTDDSE